MHLLIQETLVPSLDQEDSLEKEMATHSSVFTWGILWTEEPGGLQSMGVAKSQTWLSNTTLSPHGCSFKSWERLKFHSELQTRCSVVLDFLKHLSISPQHLKIDESLPAYLMNQVPSCVKWEFWALHLGSISGLWAVVDIRWDNALCGQQVHDRGWHLACEPLKIWFCSFPHSPYLSASCQHSPVTKWLQGWYVARYWEHRQNPCGPSQELHAGGGRGEGGPGCPSAPLSPRAAPPRMPTSPDLPLLTHFFFLNSPCWRSHQLMFISGTLPAPSRRPHMAETGGACSAARSLPKDGAVVSGYFILLYSQCYLPFCGLWILNVLTIVIASRSLYGGRVATCFQFSDVETWGLMCVSDVPLLPECRRRWHVCDALGAVPDVCQYEHVCVSRLCLPPRPTLPPDLSSPLATRLMHIPDL